MHDHVPHLLFTPRKDTSAMKKILLVLPCAAVLSLVFTGVFAPVSLFGQSAPSEKTAEEPDNAPELLQQRSENLSDRNGAFWQQATNGYQRTAGGETNRTAAARKSDSPPKPKKSRTDGARRQRPMDPKAEGRQRMFLAAQSIWRTNTETKKDA